MLDLVGQHGGADDRDAAITALAERLFGVEPGARLAEPDRDSPGARRVGTSGRPPPRGAAGPRIAGGADRMRVR